jgi:16S rRNA (cytidine1402-2'-O)-methyltransferase
MNTDKPGVCYVVSTPIGNLRDITLRAVDTLKLVDCIVCEDTRVTLKLLNRLEIKKPLVSCHSKSRDPVLQKIGDMVNEGKNIALVTDSGTPAVSDPGARLIEQLARLGAEIVPVPGPSSVHAAIAASGFSFSEYSFLGFVSNKRSRRKKTLSSLKERRALFVFFESPHRILSFLEDVLDTLGPVRACVGKEMTKKFEKFYRGSIAEIIKMLEEDGVKGEYTIVIDNR